jgi:uncharacterized alkaline shock family protein YloU
MADEIRLESMTVTPEVLQTIVGIATSEVEGVAGVDGTTLVDLIGGRKGIEVTADENGALTIALHVRVAYGRNMAEIAAAVQHSVADALEGMTGTQPAAVDVYVDGVVFPE